MTTPALVDAATGRGREFVALSQHRLEGSDVVPGSTLLTRDASVQAILRWDLHDQGAAMQWTLTKTGGSGAAYDAGASSVETFAGDGYVEITVANLVTARYFGLSDVDVDASNATIDYAIRYDVTDYHVVENGVQKFTISGVVAGDVLRVERIGATVYYKRNGVTYYTSLVPSAGPLRIDTSFLNAGTTLERIKLVDAGVRKAITWQHIVNVTATPTENVAGTLYARGKGTGPAEYHNAGVELRVVNASQNIGELRWLWQDTAGVLKRQVGGHFAPPTDGSYIMLTATRRWVASNKVILRYFLGDQLLAEVESVDGSIGGGTTGTTTIGARFDGTKWTDFFDGVIDELRVVDYELAPEEIAATWARISKLQPAAYRAIRDLLPPDAPISSDPSSRIQKLLNLVGNALGYAAAQTENFRNNLLPDRAFGTALERWERITEEPPKALDSIDQRRARVVGHLRQRAGASMSGVTAAVKDLLQLSETQVQFLAFDNTVREDWSHGLRTELWDAQPPAQWTIAANALRVQAANGATLKFDDGQSRGWYTCFAPALGSTNLGVPNQPGRYDGAACRIYAEFTPTTLPANGEVGVAFYNLARGHALLFGLRNNAGVYEVITQRFVDWLSQGVTVRAVSALEAHLLLLFAQPGGGALLPVTDALFTATWSSGSSGVSSYTNIQHRKEFSYMGIYARSFGPGALAGALDVSFNNVWLRWGMGTRPMRFYVYRDPALAGAPDRNAAHHVIQRLKQAHTEATVISSTSVLCDSASHGCDREPMGGF